MNSRFVMGAVRDLLEKHAFRFADEKDLQAGIEHVLTTSGWKFEREKRDPSTNDIYDFFLEHGVVLEVKMARSHALALVQIDRYCRNPDVNAVLLASTKAWHLTMRVNVNGTLVSREVTELRGKPIRYVRIRGQSF